MSRGLGLGRVRLGVGRSIAKSKHFLSKNGPTIGTIGGVIGVVLGAVGVGVASTKLNDILEKVNSDVEAVHEYVDQEVEKAENGEEYEYTREDEKVAVRQAYARAAFECVKLYSIPVLIIFASLASILISHKTMLDRAVQLSVAYSALAQGFARYRQNVIAEQGEDADKRYRFGIVSQEVEAKEIDPETGKSKKVKSTIEYTDKDPSAEYVRVFDSSNPNWHKEDMYNNQFFLKSSQNYFNDMLKAEGFVFLNDVLYHLGFEKTTAGQIVGWRYDENHNNPVGDNYIDFGQYLTCRKDKNGNFEQVIMLEFNVDGTIFDKIERKKAIAS